MEALQNTSYHPGDVEFRHYGFLSPILLLQYTVLIFTLQEGHWNIFDLFYLQSQLNPAFKKTLYCDHNYKQT